MKTNFRGVDLRRVDLLGVFLDGVQWDSRTRWPADWAERISGASVRIGPDLYEIRSELIPAHAGSRPGAAS